MEKLQALKAKIAEHQKHLDELDKSVYVCLQLLALLCVMVTDEIMTIVRTRSTRGRSNGYR